ncbi:MAG: helix-hairpin-helix domain-containing protein [Sandaracinus sp.]
MTDKRTVADVLSRLAFVHELLDGEGQRGKTYAAASRTVWQLEGDLAALHGSGALARVRGLGPSTLAVIGVVLGGATPDELTALEAKLPPGLFELRRIKGLGPAKIRGLWKGLEITSLAELEQACAENRLLELSGFGKKTQENVARAIAELRAHEGKLLRDGAMERMASLLGALRDAGISARAVGGLVRGDETIDRLEILVIGEVGPASEALAKVGVAGARLDGTKVVVHTARAEDVGVAELVHTSSPGHFGVLVAHAKARGLTLSELGLSGAHGTIACADAEAVYRAMELSPTPAERRDEGVPLVGLGKITPKLLELGDLRGALHNHTVASDGSATLREMREAARRAGLTYLGITEHSQSADYARGLTVERLRAQEREIADANASDPLAPTLLTGVESDILADGALDYRDEDLASLEVVVASGHRRFGLARAETTARMIRAARHPRTDVMGHPTGRLLLGRPPNDFDMEAFLEACAQSGCAVELNGSPHRLDLSAEHLAMAKARGVLVSIAADAHATGELDHLAHGVVIARRAGLTAEDVLNARSLTELRSWLASRRARVLS